MHFPANVEESPLQTEAETGGEAGQDLLGRRPGGSQHCCASVRRWGNTWPVNDAWSRFPLLSMHLLLPMGLLHWILVALSLASIGTHVSPWLRSHQVCAHVYKGCQVGANSFLSYARNQLMAWSSDYSYLSLHDASHILKLL